MNLKKVLTLTAASAAILSSAAAFAGGPEVMPATPACQACVAVFVPYLYIGGSAGWAFSNWNDFIFGAANNFSYNDLPFSTSADNSGFTFGGKVGYQFTEHFGVEGGGFALPDSDQSITVTVDPKKKTTQTINGEIDSWFAYGAATLRAALPFNPFLHVTGKVGGVYRELHHSGDLYSNVGDGNYATVIFGATLDYDLAPYRIPVIVGADYYYIPGSNDTFFSNNDHNQPINPNAAPAAQVVVGTISVRLAV
ncbi:MAG: hypothetical protein JSR33_03785 [Proteobacteria bacterium]|nr:hypothetical protein [Pseudomonadota bacterium]